MNTLDLKYQALVQDILLNGTRKQTRNGEVLSVFGRQIRHDMSEGFPLLTTKKMAWKQIVAELQWFLTGSDDIRLLWQRGCHIWDGDCYQAYLKADGKLSKLDFFSKIQTDSDFANRWARLGPIYGPQWRRWNVLRRHKTNIPDPVLGDSLIKWSIEGIDQINNLITELQSNPNSRRLLVSAWNTAEIPKMVLPPCHYSFQCYVRDQKYLSLMWNQRSVDVALGLPFNIASYGLLLKMIADEVGMVPDMLIGNLADTHIYTDHIDTLKEQLDRSSFDLPSVTVQDGIFSLMPGDVMLHNYKSWPILKFQLKN